MRRPYAVSLVALVTLPACSDVDPYFPDRVGGVYDARIETDALTADLRLEALEGETGANEGRISGRLIVDDGASVRTLTADGRNSDPDIVLNFTPAGGAAGEPLVFTGALMFGGDQDGSLVGELCGGDLGTACTAVEFDAQ